MHSSASVNVLRSLTIDSICEIEYSVSLSLVSIVGSNQISTKFPTMRDDITCDISFFFPLESTFTEESVSVSI